MKFFFTSFSILAILFAIYYSTDSHVDLDKEYVTSSWPIFIFRMTASKILISAGKVFLPKPLRVFDDFFGYFKAQVMYVTLDLGIPDILHDGPKNSSEIAVLTGVVNPDDITRWLRAAESFGYYEYDIKSSKWRNTKLSNLLRASHPTSMAYSLRHSKMQLFDAYDSAISALKTGQNAFEISHDGRSFFQYLKENPENNSVFNAAMALLTRLSLPLREDYNWGKECNRIIDIGGGNGQFLTDIISLHSNLNGIVFDQDHVVEAGESNLKKNHPHLLSKIAFRAGSMFELETYPKFEDGDCISVKHLLQDWSDETAMTIPQNIKRNMEGIKSKLLVVERVLKEHYDNPSNYVVDLTMMLVTNHGRLRTNLEWSSLLSKSGFSIQKLVHTRATQSIIVAIASKDSS